MVSLAHFTPEAAEAALGIGVVSSQSLAGSSGVPAQLFGEGGRPSFLPAPPPFPCVISRLSPSTEEALDQPWGQDGGEESLAPLPPQC